MKIGRNAPCPCGSGKKYKACCLELHRTASMSLTEQVHQQISLAETWRADLQPLPIYLEKEPTGRPVAILIEAAGMVAGFDVVDKPSAEAEDVASLLADRITKTVQEVGSHPERVEVRHPEVAAALTSALEARGLPVPVGGCGLGEMDPVWCSLMADMVGTPQVAVPHMPATWASWDRPTAWIADLFECAAALYDVAPWELFDDLPPILMASPNGSYWYATVMGRAGGEKGLAIYSEAEDLIQPPAEDGDPLPLPLGRSLAILFVEGHGLSKPMRREVSRAGWKIAAADAYPQLATFGTLGGGVSLADGEDLLTMMQSIASWCRALRDEEEQVSSLEWLDPRSGARFRCHQGATEPLPLGELRWEPGDAQGPGACPEAIFDPQKTTVGSPDLQVDPWLRRFEGDLRAQGLADSTCETHTRNAFLFLHYLFEHEAVPLEAIHEADLLMFLFNWYPRKVVDSDSSASRLIASLKRFFDFLHQSAQIHCPWAKPLLAEKQRFLATWDAFQDPEGGMMDEQRVDFGAEARRRLLMPREEIPELFAWAPLMGKVENGLIREIDVLWRSWRDAALREGVAAPEDLQALLEAKEVEWLQAPHPDHGGKSPIEAIEVERAAG